LVQKPKRPEMRPGSGQNSIIEKISNQLELADGQVFEYKLMAEKHGKQMRVLQEDHRLLMKSYFETLITSSIDSPDSIKNEILKIESEKLRITYEHFRELKSILTAQQNERFELIMKDILVILIGEENKLPPPPRD
jgi:hypothetical protein